MDQSGPLFEQYEVARLKRLYQASEARYRRLVQAVTDYVYTVQVDDGRPAQTVHSEACTAVTGYTSHEFAHDPYLWINMVHEEDREKVRRHGQLALTGEKPAALEHRIRRKDGQLRWVQNTIVPHFDQQGRLISYDGLVKDITERKEAEETRRKSQQELQLTLEAITDGVFKWNFTTNEFVFSPHYYTMLGYEPDEFAASFDSWRNLIHPDDLPRALAVYETWQKSRPDIYENEFRLKAKSGEYRWIHASGKVVERDGQGNAVRLIGNHQDVTERKRAEETMRTAQRLEAMGILADGIVHDFNNMLGGIFGYIDMAREYCKDNPWMTLLLNKALDTYERAKDLSVRLRTFAKGDKAVKRRASVATLLKESAALMLAGSNIKRSFAIAADVEDCEVDTGQILEVFNNLLINARQAMPEGGTLLLGADNATVNRKDGTRSWEGPFVRITVKDNGMGIKKENIPRIFDPFFTTKDKGSGLGLAVSNSIVLNHGGFIEVDSEPGRGAEFRIFLPAVARLSQSPLEKLTDSRHGQGRILIMDDEGFMLDVAASMLSKAGYTIETATDGEQAMAKFRQALAEQRPFDVVILDLTIPGGMGGKQVVREMRKLYPSVKAIASSGYSDDPAMTSPAEFGFLATLSKPYKREDLDALLRQVLSAEAPAR
jgi:PAS domain S-box-containing protein